MKHRHGTLPGGFSLHTDPTPREIFDINPGFMSSVEIGTAVRNRGRSWTLAHNANSEELPPPQEFENLLLNLVWQLGPQILHLRQILGIKRHGSLLLPRSTTLAHATLHMNSQLCRIQLRTTQLLRLEVEHPEHKMKKQKSRHALHNADEA
jgi:hypothetical protein